MTDIKEKAQEMLLKVQSDYPHLSPHTLAVLVLERTIERHEAFKQEVSDAVAEYKADQPYVWKQSASDYFCRFIIPAPKPDPLVEVMDELGWCNTELLAREFRAALDARGLEIREKGQ